MMRTFNPEHVSAFKAIGEEPTWIGSRHPRSWAKQIGASARLAEHLPDDRLSVDRPFLKSFCADSSNSPEQCFAAIMAWGGMRVGHGALAWDHRDHWSSIIEALREGSLKRSEAYQQFYDLRRRYPRCGMGPAFFTKLIFFAGTSHDGYIMDQWTALSMNLLAPFDATPMISMTSGQHKGRRWDRVADSNKAETYEVFCSAIEGLSEATGWQSESVEMRLFSQGGRKSEGAWRRYVKDRRPAL